MFFDGPFDFTGDGMMSPWENDLEYAAFRSTMGEDPFGWDDEDGGYDAFDDFDDFDEDDDF